MGAGGYRPRCLRSDSPRRHGGSGKPALIERGRSLESRLYLDGLNVGDPHGGNRPPHYVAEIGNASEVTFTTSGGVGESETAGQAELK